MTDIFAVLVREDGKLLGRLTPDGYAVNRKIFAGMFTKERADMIAEEINADGTFTAKVIPF